jgi:hypothetical protein
LEVSAFEICGTEVSNLQSPIIFQNVPTNVSLRFKALLSKR